MLIQIWSSSQLLNLILFGSIIQKSITDSFFIGTSVKHPNKKTIYIIILSSSIDATAESGRLGRLVNHSRNGNLLTKALWVDGPRLVLLAAHDIAPGDELTYDYGDRSKESLQHHPWLAL